MTLGESIDREVATALKANPDAAYALPPPEETWKLADVPELDQGTLNLFRESGIVDRHSRDRVVRNGTRRGKTSNWQTDYRAYQWAQEHCAPSQDRLPCGHRGVRNVPDGEFTCLDEDCEQEFEREVAEAILQS